MKVAGESAPSTDTPIPTDELVVASAAQASERFMSDDMRQMIVDMAEADKRQRDGTTEKPAEVKLSELEAIDPAAADVLEEVSRDLGLVELAGAGVEAPSEATAMPAREIDGVVLDDSLAGDMDEIEAFANTAGSGSGEDTPPTVATAEDEPLPPLPSTPDVVDTPVAPATRPVIRPQPISGRRIINKEQGVTTDLSKGHIDRLGARLSGTRQLRADKKHIIKSQKEALEGKYADAKGDVWNARGQRLANYAHYNALNRYRLRSQRRAELRQSEFDRIDEAGIGGIRRLAKRLQTRKNSWKIARQQIRTESTKAFNEARGNVVSLKNERHRQKLRRKQVTFRPWRARKTLGGSGSAGRHENWVSAGKDLDMSERAQQADRQRRLDELKKRQQKLQAHRRRHAAPSR